MPAASASASASGSGAAPQMKPQRIPPRKLGPSPLCRLLSLLLLLLLLLLVRSGGTSEAAEQLSPRLAVVVEEEKGNDNGGDGRYRGDEREAETALSSAPMLSSLRRPGEAAADADAEASGRREDEEVSNDGTYPPAATSPAQTDATAAATAAAAALASRFQPRLRVVEGQPAHHGIASISNACTYHCCCCCCGFSGTKKDVT
jgi:hypothetical protein